MLGVNHQNSSLIVQRKTRRSHRSIGPPEATALTPAPPLPRRRRRPCVSWCLLPGGGRKESASGVNERVLAQGESIVSI